MLYQRQKFLITFLHFFGGELSRTNCQKLIFLYCQYNNQTYYNFFPYKFGPFSYVLFDDKRALTKKGVLNNVDDFSLSDNALSVVKDYDIKEKMLLIQFREKLKGIRGQVLIQKTYDEYPHFAINSEIKTIPHFSKDKVLPVDDSVLFSIGYEGKSIDQFLNKLVKRNIEYLFDVRNNPISRKYGFSKTKLEKYSQSIGINYIHLPELGIPSANRKKISSKEDLHNLFTFYNREILELAIDKVNIIINTVKDKHPSVLVCFEEDFNLCHRNQISKKIFKLSGVSTTHL